MRGTCRFARSGARVVAVDSVFVSVILVPLVLAPLVVVGEGLFRVFYIAAVLFTKLLSELERARGAVLDALTDLHAFRLVDLRSVSLSRHVGGV